MAYTDPATLTFATNENPLASAKMNTAINNQFLALFPDGAVNLDWDPTLLADGVAPDMSNLDGGSYRIGALQFLWARANISNPGSGEYYIELPTAPVGIVAGTVVGSVFFQDSSSSANNAPGVVLLAGGAPDQIRFAFDGGNLSSTHPVPTASGDALTIHAVYPIA